MTTILVQRYRETTYTESRILGIMQCAPCMGSVFTPPPPSNTPALVSCAGAIAELVLRTHLDAEKKRIKLCIPVIGLPII